MARFFSFVEIQTKITSLFAFSIGLAFLVYQGYEIRPLATLVFFLSMFIFDLTTTAINNYIDSKTNGIPLQYERGLAKNLIFAMLGLATFLGLVLVLMTDLVVLVLGGICFFFGIIYTYGPVAISRIPLGEVFSGIFYGFFIPLILAYIQLPAGEIIAYGFAGGVLSLAFNLKWLLMIGLLALVPTLTTANIMLANNICDLERDLAVNRFTLPYYLGKEQAVKLYGWLYDLSFAAILLLVVSRLIPAFGLLAILIGLPLARNNIKTFEGRQIKAETFVTSIKNYILLNGLLLLSIVAGILKDSLS